MAAKPCFSYEARLAVGTTCLNKIGQSPRERYDQLGWGFHVDERRDMGSPGGVVGHDPVFVQSGWSTTPFR
jgi:hypothetical protein